MARPKKTAVVVEAPVSDFVPDAVMLRTCDKDGKSYGGFQWPLTKGAIVTARDWSPEPVCGGLHGLIGGIGNWDLLSDSDDAKWMLCAIMRSESVVIDEQKIKVPRCRVDFVGSRAEVLSRIPKSMVAEISFSVNEATKDIEKKKSAAATTGYRSAAATTGYSSAAATTGDRSAAATTGTGRRRPQRATGRRRPQRATGRRRPQRATGRRRPQRATGRRRSQRATGRRRPQRATGRRRPQRATGRRRPQRATGRRRPQRATGRRRPQRATGRRRPQRATGRRRPQRATGRRLLPLEKIRLRRH